MTRARWLSTVGWLSAAGWLTVTGRTWWAVVFSLPALMTTGWQWAIDRRR